MGDRYNLKLEEPLKKIVEIYMKFGSLKRGNTIASYLKPAINKEINSMLDELEKKMENNPDLQKLLEKEDYKDVLYLLESKKRF